MLCPKCGYITFDKLSECPKCNKNWENDTEKISGTSSSTDAPCFLGKVLKDSSSTDSKLDEVSESKSSPPDSDSADEEGEHSGIQSGEDDGDEIAFDDLEEEESLDVALDELQEIDIADSENESEVEVSEEIDFTIDAGDDDLAQPPVPSEEDEPEKGTTVDLNEIDLSGLVQDDEGSEDVEIDMGDLSSGEIEMNVPDSSAPEEIVSPSIDLDLDGEEDMLDLSLDLESDLPPEDKKDDPVIPDLGLSLDQDD